MAVTIIIVPIKIQNGAESSIAGFSMNSLKLTPPIDAIKFGMVITAVRTAINFILLDPCK